MIEYIVDEGRKGAGRTQIHFGKDNNLGNLERETERHRGEGKRMRMAEEGVMTLLLVLGRCVPNTKQTFAGERDLENRGLRVTTSPCVLESCATCLGSQKSLTRGKIHNNQKEAWHMIPQHVEEPQMPNWNRR
jgi:hypothetical protein